MNLVNKISLTRILLIIFLFTTNYCVISQKNDPEQWKTAWTQFESTLSLGKKIKLIDHYDRKLFNFPALNTKFGNQFKIKSLAGMTSFIPKEKAQSLRNVKSPMEVMNLDTYSSSIPILIYIEPKNKNNQYEFKGEEIIQKSGKKILKLENSNDTCTVVALIETKLYYKEFFDELLSKETISQKQYNLYTDFESIEDCSLIENEFDKIDCRVRQKVKIGFKSYLESEIPLPLLKCKF
ncbi:hypothetical protein [Leptospira santarosai]|uniref:hypothetical protein n=1 Tax=Leptospira santarosai TaxID=28183 RepID=UPI0024AE9FFE|nr:hypothetical protein [Leptospira santarosai]MDI7191012.1 hypothetical protein [Leptospira santarosai]MDI7214182.1 hypothetical protein [Leptospira santarosai]